MGYRDDFYTVGNMIGYSGNLHDFPTAYFQSGNEFGHITQRHDIPQNVGRQEVRSDANYAIDNVMTADGLRLVEWDSNGAFHVSRSTLTRVQNMLAGDVAVLAQAIINCPNEKYISDFSDETFDVIDNAELWKGRLVRQIAVRAQRGTLR